MHLRYALALGLLTVSAAEAQTVLTTARVAAGVSRPVWVGTPPRDHARLFFIEQFRGTVNIIKNGARISTPFLDISSKSISFGNERGLLGLAFHPDYASNGYFFVNYNRTSDGATVIERYTVSKTNADRADASSGKIILVINQPYSNHNGGDIHFGPDGYLYIGMGDGGSAGDPQCFAQNGQSLLGKILRIDIDNGNPYSSPKTNPFVGNAKFRDEIWSLGWRNPWRFSFDRKTGDMYAGDVGQNRKEEISFQPAGKGGLNFGWKIMEGNNCFSTSRCQSGLPQCNAAALVKPIHDYANPSVGCSVTGGFVYRGCAIPDLQGTYFFADYCSRRIWSFRYVGGKMTQFQDRTTELRPVGGNFGRISAFGEDACGEIYIADFNGQIHKIVPKAGAPARDLGFGKIGGNGKTLKFEVCGLLNKGNSALLQMRDGPVSAAAGVLISNRNSPVQALGTTIVPSQPQLAVGFMTDKFGEYSVQVPGGVGPAVVYGQMFAQDKGASFGVGVSNALQITFQ